MSEERFDRIDQRLERLEAGQNELKAHVGRLEAHAERLDDHVGRLEGHVERLDDRVGRLEGRFDVLDRHMHVLHEDVIARIAAIPEYTGPTKTEFAELKELIGRRLDPLEMTVRQHSRDIEQLKNARPS